MTALLRIGIDVGGTKIEAVVLDPSGKEIARKRLATPQGDVDATISTIVALVHGLETKLGRRATVGIGTPGSISPATGLIRNANSTCLNGLKLDALLATALDRPVRLENDANCFALSEAVDGAGAGGNIVFGVILGTGVGGGIVVHGKLISGINGVAGEWGHNSLPRPTKDERPGPACYCGQNGCIETFLSGPAFAADHRRRTGVEASTVDIVRDAEAGDPACQESMRLYADRLARGLASLVNVLDPDVIVLGGGMSNIASLYESVPRLWKNYVFSDVVRTRLVRAHHGDSSGVRGAAWLWNDHEAMF